MEGETYKSDSEMAASWVNVWDNINPPVSNGIDNGWTLKMTQ